MLKIAIIEKHSIYVEIIKFGIKAIKLTYIFRQ